MTEENRKAQLDEVKQITTKKAKITEEIDAGAKQEAEGVNEHESDYAEINSEGKKDSDNEDGVNTFRAISSARRSSLDEDDESEHREPLSPMQH